MTLDEMIAELNIRIECQKQVIVQYEKQHPAPNDSEEAEELGVLDGYLEGLCSAVNFIENNREEQS